MKKLGIACLVLIVLGAVSTVVSKDKVEESPSTQITEEAIEPEERVEEPNDEIPQGDNVVWENCSDVSVHYEAPVSWKHIDSYGNTYFIPADGYRMSVYYNVNQTREAFVERDVSQYSDAKVEDLEVNGHPATLIEYDSDLYGKNEHSIVCYIEVYPTFGVALVNYSAPAEAPDRYLAEYERMLKSVTIEESDYEVSIPKSEYVLNRSTGVFHEPNCYKVSGIDDKVYVTSTFAEMISEGYEGCGTCNPH